MTDSTEKSLAQKLDIKPNNKIYLLNEPQNYLELLGPLPDNVTFLSEVANNLDMIHLFTASEGELKSKLGSLQSIIKPNGMIWVSWPKKSSNQPTDLTEQTIRDIALPMGLVDVKVCAVDATWSALKLVIRRENRR